MGFLSQCASYWFTISGLGFDLVGFSMLSIDVGAVALHERNFKRAEKDYFSKVETNRGELQKGRRLAEEFRTTKREEILSKYNKDNLDWSPEQKAAFEAAKSDKNLPTSGSYSSDIWNRPVSELNLFERHSLYELAVRRMQNKVESALREAETEAQKIEAGDFEGSLFQDAADASHRFERLRVERKSVSPLLSGSGIAFVFLGFVLQILGAI